MLKKNGQPNMSKLITKSWINMIPITSNDWVLEQNIILKYNTFVKRVFYKSMAKIIIRQMQNICIHKKGKTFHVTGPTLRGS